MNTQEKISYIESYGYKVDADKDFIKITDPLDGKDGFKLTAEIDDEDAVLNVLNETIEMINCANATEN